MKPICREQSGPIDWGVESTTEVLPAKEDGWSIGDGDYPNTDPLWAQESSVGMSVNTALIDRGGEIFDLAKISSYVEEDPYTLGDTAAELERAFGQSRGGKRMLDTLKKRVFLYLM
jgi:hypothetical protein